MTQTISLSAALGPAQAGLSIGYRILNLDGTTYSVFTTTDVVESNVAGTYYIENGVVAPNAGGYAILGTSEDDYVVVAIDSIATVMSAISAVNTSISRLGQTAQS